MTLIEVLPKITSIGMFVFTDTPGVQITPHICAIIILITGKPLACPLTALSMSAMLRVRISDGFVAMVKDFSPPFQINKLISHPI
jgi:hypothetical protein